MSGSYDFTPQVDDLLTEAWERCKLNPSIITGDQSRSARRSLYAMMVDWTNRGLNLWQIDRQFTTVATGVQIISLPDGSADALEVMVTAYGSEMALSPLSRDEWASIPNKALRSRPTQFWTDRRADGPVIHLWPVPDRSYQLAINRLRLPQDMGSMADALDAPALWLEAMYAGLAARLAAKYCPDALEAKLAGLAQQAYSNAAREDRERVPLTLLPEIP